MDLAPRFYTSVRIYSGALMQGLGLPDLLELEVVKSWHYSASDVWHAERTLAVAG